ncbi:MAG: hypothetical protein EBR82_17730 [Caulobacteraceae bacterium]|nr:hypothetical protein [Caulobacteraceae bacterium]
MSYPCPEHGPLLEKYGQMITTWNDVEYQWSSALLYFEKPDTSELSITAQILAAQLSSYQLSGFAQAVAHELVTGECQTVMLEAIKHLDILRDYRNYYVHGFQALGWSNGIPAGMLLTRTVRGRLVDHNIWIQEAELDSLIAQLQDLRLVMGKVLGVWRHQHGALHSDDCSLPELGARPVKLDLPKRLVFGRRDD